MADHSTELIKDIKVDDAVIATDPTTGKTTPRRVTALHLNEDTDLVDLAVVTGTGSTAILHTTQHHAFWDETQGGWTDAVNLQPGDRLHALDGQIETVTAVRLLTLLHPMYNLTVDTDHTYYVIAGATPVLVHNCPPDGFEPSRSGKGNTPRNNQAQNKAFRGAVQEIERSVGRRLTKDEIRQLHDEITGQGYGYQEIVDEGNAMFGN
jgi:hypothetical protein